MSGRRGAPGGAALPLLQWLLLLCGLTALAMMVPGDLEKPLSIAAGAVLGTALGQLFAWWRVRLWLAAFLGLNAVWVGALMLWPLIASGLDAAAMVAAYLPALLCGYLCLTERGTLVSFWFPAVPWSLAILEVEPDGSALDGSALGSTASLLLLAGLGVMLLGTFWAREKRRVAEWSRSAIEPLATPADRIVLREGTLRGLARAGWALALGSAVIFLTAWIAPHLRRVEMLEGPRPSKVAKGSSEPESQGKEAGAGPVARCCPETPVSPPPARRVREYFPFAPPRSTPSLPPPPSCVACTDGVPNETLPRGHAGADGLASTADPAVGGAERAASETHGSSTRSRAGRPNDAHPDPLRVEPALAPPPKKASTPRGPERPVSARRIGPPSPASSGLSGRVARTPAGARATAPPRDGGLPLGGLLAFAGSAVAVHLALRPARRWITLRHLLVPFWRESVAQRVSNLWQLALVGLRDAGWRTVPGEQPQELARRVEVSGMQTCATTLERARHGVRVDAADLEAMEIAARLVYGLARRRAGWMARAVAWWRWPLV